MTIEMKMKIQRLEAHVAALLERLDSLEKIVDVLAGLPLGEESQAKISKILGEEPQPGSRRTLSISKSKAA